MSVLGQDKVLNTTTGWPGGSWPAPAVPFSVMVFTWLARNPAASWRAASPRSNASRHPLRADRGTPETSGLGAGDGVVVRAEHQLPPRLVQRLRRVAGASQPGQRGQPLAVADGHLGGALCLLGVGVGDVLARVDRVHVPGLRGQPDTAPGGLGAHGREELPRQPGHAPRPHVAGREVAVHRGRPPGRDHVIGADRQQHVPGGRHRGQRRELLERRDLCGRRVMAAW